MSSMEKLEAEVEIKSAADKFHEVFSRRLHHLKTMAPNLIKDCHLHDGVFGKPGTVVLWTYNHDEGKKTAKELVENIDDVNKSTTLRVVEGDLLKDYKVFRTRVKATPKGEGSVVTWTFEYERKSPETPHPNTLAHFVVIMSKDIDLYLLNN